MPHGDDLRQNRDRHFFGGFRADIEPDRTANARDRVFAHPGGNQALAPVSVRLATSDRADIFGASSPACRPVQARRTSDRASGSPHRCSAARSSCASASSGQACIIWSASGKRSSVASFARASVTITRNPSNFRQLCQRLRDMHRAEDQQRRRGRKDLDRRDRLSAPDSASISGRVSDFSATSNSLRSLNRSRIERRRTDRTEHGVWQHDELAPEPLALNHRHLGSSQVRRSSASFSAS